MLILICLYQMLYEYQQQQQQKQQNSLLSNLWLIHLGFQLTEIAYECRGRYFK